MTIRYTTDIEEIKNSRDYNLKKANSFKQLLDEILKVLLQRPRHRTCQT